LISPSSLPPWLRDRCGQLFDRCVCAGQRSMLRTLYGDLSARFHSLVCRLQRSVEMVGVSHGRRPAGGAMSIFARTRADCDPLRDAFFSPFTCGISLADCGLRERKMHSFGVLNAGY
jgi:hypothetical protein